MTEVEVATGDDPVVYAASRSRVYRSSDEGASWERVAKEVDFARIEQLVGSDDVAGTCRR
jgi:hypothetical protein